MSFSVCSKNARDLRANLISATTGHAKTQPKQRARKSSETYFVSTLFGRVFSTAMFTSDFQAFPPLPLLHPLNPCYHSTFHKTDKCACPYFCDEIFPFGTFFSLIIDKQTLETHSQGRILQEGCFSFVKTPETVEFLGLLQKTHRKYGSFVHGISGSKTFFYLILLSSLLSSKLVSFTTTPYLCKIGSFDHMRTQKST